MNLKQKLMGAGFSSALVLAGVLIAPSEGYREAPYLDPKQILTVCWGHTGGIIKTKVYNEKECMELYKGDLLEADKVLKYYLKPEIYNSLKDYQKAAFISFVFNVGIGKKDVKDGFVFLKNGNYSTMFKKLNSGDTKGACQEFPKWNRDKLPGIIIRRKKEMDLCMGIY